MKALVYHGPGSRSWDWAPEPEITDPRDAVVRVDAATICGTDLHILKGDVPEVEPERTLGHEAVGTVERIGDEVRGVGVGDRVLVSCITGCGQCRYCRQGRYGQCLEGGGWILGHLIDGTQADYVRVPFAQNALHRLPDGVTDEAALMLADILPTSYEVGALNGRVAPGDTVVVVGAGPIGLAAVVAARLFSPSRVIVLDVADSRLQAAKQIGADATLHTDLYSSQDAEAAVMDMTGGPGADVAIEAVGVPESFEQCVRLTRPGGHVANIGVHGEPATLHLESVWSRDLTITTGLVDTSSTPTLLRMLAAGQLDVSGFVTHRFGLDEMSEAYDVFSDPGSGAVKVALFRA